MKKLIALVIVAVMLLSMMPMVTLAATPDTLYLKPNSNWVKDGARFAAYFFGNGEKWVSMKDPDGDGIYEVDAPAGYPQVIFCRMNPGTSTNNWNSKWNQTEDLTIPTDGRNLFTVKDGTWDKGGGTWSTHTASGSGEQGGDEPQPVDTFDIYVKTPWDSAYIWAWHENGDNDISVSTEWPGIQLNVVGDGWFTGEIPVSAGGQAVDRLIVAEKNGGAQTADLTVTVADQLWIVVEENASAAVSTSNPETSTGTVPVHVKLDGVSMNAAYLYTWGFPGGIKIEANGSWPGSVLSADPYNSGWLTANVSADTSWVIVNNNSGTQTADIDITEGKETWIVVAGTSNTDCSVSTEAPTGWYTSAPIEVTLNPGEGTVTSTTLIADPDGNVTLPAASRAGYVFDGWYEEATFTTLVGQAGATATFTEATTIYAKWSEDTTGKHTIKFMDGDDEFTSAITVKFDGNIGKLASIPNGPTAPANYTFGGWYKDLNDENSKVTTNTEFTEGTAVYAKWIENQYTISFDLNYEGATGAPAAKTTSAFKITLPADPTREGYTFNGWYDAATGGNKVENTNEYSQNTTLYAQWTADVTYIVAGSSGLCGTEWTPGDTNNQMTKNGDVYTITYTNVAPGNYEFKVTQGSWEAEAWPGSNYTFGVTAACDVTITFNPNTRAIIVEGDSLGVYVPTEPTYFVAGSAGLCNGVEWGVNNADNQMTKNGDVYTITYTDVAAGNYEFKVTDGTWTNAWPSSNYAFGVAATGDVTITFDPVDEEITVTGDTLGEYTPDDDDDDQGGGTTPPPTDEKITVHAKVPTDWEAAYLYAWIGSTNNSWPGVAMAEGTEGWWTAQIPANMENIIVTADAAGPQTIDKSLAEVDGDVIWIILGEQNPDGYHLAEVTDVKPDSFSDENAGNYVPPAAPTDFYLVGYINGADFYETTHKFVNGKLTITLTADSYAMIKDNNGAVYGTAAYCTAETANMAIGGGEKMFVPKGEITFTLTVNADGTVKLSYTVPAPEGGEQGGNESGTGTGNPEPPTGSLIIHAKVPTAWASAYLYAWNTASDVMASWPGTAMTKGDDGWYTIEIPAGYRNIIVAEKNGGEQTVDLSIANVTGNEIWVTLGEKNSNGKYPATIAEDEKGEEVVAPPEEKEITVYAKVPTDWTTPYVYAWNGSGNNASWPGIAMTKGENGWWYAKVPASAENVIISNNGTPQTVDLKLEKLSVDVWVQFAAAGADGKYTASVQYSTNPDTGDTTIIAPVAILLVLSVTGLAVLTVGKKKYF